MPLCRDWNSAGCLSGFLYKAGGLLRRPSFLVLLWCTGAGLWIVLWAAECLDQNQLVLFEIIENPVQTGLIAEDHIPVNNSATDNSCININMSELKELTLLPGIGPALAERIVVYRESGGPFTCMADLERVKGIGPAKLEKIKGRVCF